ncbi:MAG TPA: GFA family protein [Solirubrobacteraceae bacterium]|nr:GFA family protein [Solirubrobacteraceae bacterium]
MTPPASSAPGEISFPLTGACGCGTVRYEITEPFVSASYCHCTRCQRRTGASASANGRAAPGSFRIIAGEERLRAWRPDDGFEKWFCGDCGSAIFSRDPNDHDAVGVRLGTLDDDPGIRPSYRQFVAYAVPWEDIPDDGLTRYPEGRRQPSD